MKSGQFCALHIACASAPYCWKMNWGDWKCGSGKCDTGKNAKLENAGVDSRSGKCRSSLAVWKAEYDTIRYDRRD